MMKQFGKKLLSLLLVVVLVLQIVPATVFATEETEDLATGNAPLTDATQDIFADNTFDAATAEEALASAEVLFEETSLREENVKHFRMDDGSYIAVSFGLPVHYQDENGEWVDYDNTLTPVTTLNASNVSSYRVENGDSIRIFAADADAEQLLTLQKGDFSLSFSPVQMADAELTAVPDHLVTASLADADAVTASILEIASAGEVPEDPLLAQTQPDKFYSALEYADAISGANLRYENYGGTIKESIIISAPQSAYSYTFQMETDGLAATLEADGSVSLLDEDGTLVYFIPAPYMIDANNEYSYDAAYTLTGDNGSYTLTVTADAQWLNDANRAFPVTLDPTIVEPSITNGTFSGTYVRSGWANATADDTGIYVGNNGNTNKKTRGYFHADSIPWLPTGSEVFYAEFSLYQYSYERQTNGATSLQVGLYPIVDCPNPAMTTTQWQSFISGLTWNKVDGSSATYIHDANAMIDKVTVSASTTSTYSTWNITALARKWYGEYQMNLGFALIAEEENNATSRVCFYGPNSSSCLPQFLVAYRSGVGIESYYSYQTIGIGRAGTSYISDYTLQNTLVVPLMSSSSNTMPFSLSLVYNSVYCENQFDDDNNICTKDFSSWQTGAGWKLSIQQTLIRKSVGGTTYLVYNDADGTEHYFIYSSAYGGYVDLDGLGLVVTGSTSSYTMKDLYGYKKIFTNGYLTQEQDAYGNKLIYTYDSGIITVQRQNVGATAETIAQIGYASSRLNTVVSECDFTNNDDKAAHRTSFQYTTVNSVPLLTKITFPDGAAANYSYYTASTDDSWDMYRLKTAYDAECGYGLEYSYSYGLDVCNIYEYNANGKYGEKLHAYKRTHNRTVYRYYGDDGNANTSDDLLTFALQDSRGRPISAYTTDYTETNVLGVSAGAWTENSGGSRQNNRLTTSVNSGQQSVNLLSNGSMENSSVSTNSFGSWLRSSSTYIKPLSIPYEQETSAGFVRSTASTTVDKLYQNVTLNCGETYTLAAYVKVSGSVTFTDVGGVSLSIRSSSGGTTYASSETLNYSTVNAGDGWLRLYATYTIPAGSGTVSRRVYITATGYTGTIYVDAVQLEAADAPSTFNLLENGSFESDTTLNTTAVTGWYRQGNGTIAAAGSPLFGSNALLLSGTGNQRALQHLDCSFSADTTFILSGWGSAHADPDGAKEKSVDSDTYYGLILHLYYSDGEDDVFYYPFDVYDAQWQYTQGVAVAKSAGDGAKITDIYIAAAYDNNFGTAYFDNISLRMEPVQTYTYDDNGNLITTVQAGAGETNAAYDGVDLISYTAANGSTIDYTYNSAHDILTATCDGVTGTYTYSTKGNVEKSTLTGGSLKLQSTAAYSTDGDHVTRVRNANNQLVEYAYNTADERLTSSTVKVTDSSGQEVIHSTSAYTYDNAGRITGTTLSNASSELASIGYSYPDGRLSSLARTSKRSGASQIQTYNFTYNVWGQTTAVKVGSTPLASYEYEKIGNSTNSADGGGNLTKMTYGNNQSVSYSYDNLDRLIKKTYNDTGSYVEYAYNSEGALARVSSYDSNNDLLAFYVFEYDSLGRLIRSAEYDGDNALVQRTEHIYDAYNRLSSQSWVIGNTSYSESYTYDDGASGDGSLTKMTTATGDTLNYTYDALKRLNKVTTKNASGTALFSTSYAFRNLSTTSGITQTTTQVHYRNVRIGTSGTILEGKKYSYDDVGNITKISQSTSPYNPLVAYEYDSQNQLTKETYYDGAGSATGNITKTIAYTYDTAGNILSETKTVGTTTTTKNYTYSTGNWKDLLKSVTVNGTNYSISSSGGNPTNWYNGSKTYTGLTWQQGRQLAGLTVGETSVSYEYDADGIRTKMVAGDVTYEFVTQGGKLMRETATNSSAVYVMDFIYDNAGRPFAVKFSKNGGSSFTTFYYVLNLQGDVVAITKADGTVVAKYTYDAWGNLTSLINANGTEIVNRTTGTAIAFWNPLTYRGYIRDRETGFYYLQSRYYDPANHRFINADSYASTGKGFAGTNMFAYCNNSPVLYADYDGKNTDILDWWAGAMWWLCGADSVLPVGDIIYGGGLLILGVVVWFTADEATDASVPQIYIEEDEEKAEPEIPDVTYPGDDPTKAPEGTEWRGSGEQGSKQGNYYNPKTGESWHPDLDHPEPIGPHWDYRDSNGTWWRIGKDNIPVLK